MGHAALKEAVDAFGVVPHVVLPQVGANDAGTTNLRSTIEIVQRNYDQWLRSHEGTWSRIEKTVGGILSEDSLTALYLCRDVLARGRETVAKQAAEHDLTIRKGEFQLQREVRDLERTNRRVGLLARKSVNAGLRILKRQQRKLDKSVDHLDALIERVSKEAERRRAMPTAFDGDVEAIMAETPNIIAYLAR